MRIPKKYAAGVLALLVAMALPAGTRGVAAEPVFKPEPDVTVTIGSTQVTTGDSFSIPVKIKANKEVSAYNLQIDYNPDYLDITAVTPVYGQPDEELALTDAKGYITSHTSLSEGWVRTAWIDTNVGSGTEHPIIGEEALFTIQAKSKGKVGTAAFTVVQSDPEKNLFTDSLFDSTGKPGLLTAEIIRGEVSFSSPSDYFSGGAGRVKVYVDGKEQQFYATAAQTTINGKTVSKVTVDNAKALSLMEQNQLNKLTLVVSDASQKRVVGGLNGKLVKAMENKQAQIELVTPFAAYTLPAEQIRIDHIFGEFPGAAALEDIEISVGASQLEGNEAAAVQASVEAAGGKLVSTPVDFTVEASYGGKQVEISQFNHYVERSISLPVGEGEGKSLFTTAAVVRGDGTLSHVPTRIVEDNGQTKAVINSMTNSVYALVYTPKTFMDIQNHWSKTEVSDLASRMIIQGQTAEAFAPDRNISRAEFTAVLLRGLGLGDSLRASPLALADIASTDWFAGHVNTAVSYGLVNGYEDGTFRPHAPISRAEAMTVLVRANKLLPSVSRAVDADKVLAAFTDGGLVEVWAKEAVASAIAQGLVQGSDGQIKPGDRLTRAESAALVRRMLVHADMINP